MIAWFQASPVGGRLNVHGDVFPRSGALPGRG